MREDAMKAGGKQGSGRGRRGVSDIRNGYGRRSKKCSPGVTLSIQIVLPLVMAPELETPAGFSLAAHSGESVPPLTAPVVAAPSIYTDVLVLLSEGSPTNAVVFGGMFTVIAKSVEVLVCTFTLTDPRIVGIVMLAYDREPGCGWIRIFW